MVGTRDVFLDSQDESLDDRDFSGIFYVGKGESVIHPADTYHQVPTVSARRLLVRRTFAGVGGAQQAVLVNGAGPEGAVATFPGGRQQGFPELVLGSVHSQF